MINPGAEMVDGAVSICCQQCGKYPEKERASAFFCDDKCRMRWHSANRKREKVMKQALQNIETVIANMPLRGDSSEWNLLCKIEEMIKEAKWKVES